MSVRHGIIAGLSVLAFVCLGFVLFYAKSMFAATSMSSASNACYQEAKANPNDRMTYDRCMKAKGMLVEDTPKPGEPRVINTTPTYKPLAGGSYDECRRSPKVLKYKPKTSSWATEVMTCMIDNGGHTAVIRMHRNPSTGEIEFDVAH